VKRPKLTAPDRLLWAWLSAVWSEWQSTIAIVKPATVIGWHRQGFPDAEYLSDGISETLMTQLSRLPR
jgi:hypothetical protein